MTGGGNVTRYPPPQLRMSLRTTFKTQSEEIWSSGGNEEKVKEKAPQAKKIAFWAPRRGAKTSKMKEKVMKIGQNRLFRRPNFEVYKKAPPIGDQNFSRGAFL